MRIRALADEDVTDRVCGVWPFRLASFCPARDFIRQGSYWKLLNCDPYELPGGWLGGGAVSAASPFRAEESGSSAERPMFVARPLFRGSKTKLSQIDLFERLCRLV